MDPTRLIRDPVKVQAALKRLDDKSLVNASDKDITIYIPARYVEYKLAVVAADIYTVGIFCMVVGGEFSSVSLTNAMLRITPAQTNRIKIRGDEYLEFVFPPGSTVLPTVEVAKIDTLVYNIFDEFFSKGRMPWFMNYDDACSLLSTAHEYAGANIGREPEVIELVTSMVARSPADRTKYYRTFVKDRAQLGGKPPLYVALKSVSYSATNTTARLAGAHFNEGLISALNNPTERVEHIESLLRQ